MNREEKKNIISSLSVKLKEGSNIYFTKIHGLDAVQTASLRRLCFERGVSLLVVKNRLLKKAMEEQDEKDFSDFFDLLKENTSLMISDSSKAPAKIIKDFLEKNGTETPMLKGAFINNEVYLGHENVDMLSTLKSREELIGDVLALLQSPIKNLVSSLNSSSNNLTGILKSLSERTDDLSKEQPVAEEVPALEEESAEEDGE
jgi:large subunit ribosomal protein L10